MATSGLTVQTFVIKDKTGLTSVGYYIVCERSPADPEQLICHLEPIGATKDAMRKIVWKKGVKELGRWARDRYGASSLLFD